MSGAIDIELDARLSRTLAALEHVRAELRGVDGVSIPGVVVTGAQSADKSSVLEALGGMKLPRGQNITTRVPLVLSLQKTSGSEPHAIISGDADPTAGKRIGISDISDEISALTIELAGDGAGVSATPIYIRIIRPTGPTLTLIDLPDITHYSADGSQDINAETVSLVTKYIENKNMVILVVISAMEDFAKAEAVMLAKTFDPQGKRTLGVVTKVDNVQAGCGIRDKLRMETRHLKLGFIAVVNRTPLEVEADTPAEDVREREKYFFENNPEVVGLEKEFWGLDTLVARVVDIQAKLVHEFIPGFIEQSTRRIEVLAAELSKMPVPSDHERERAFFMVVSRVKDKLQDLLANRSDEPLCIEGTTPVNIVRDVTVMYKNYAAGVKKEVVPQFFDRYSCFRGGPYHKKATHAYELTEGMAPPDLRAGLAFDELFREIFSDNKVETRSQGLVEGVRRYMQTVLRRLFERECEDCPALLKEIDTILVGEFIKTKENKTLEVVSNAIKTGLDWAFTLDPLCLETIAGVQEMVDSVRKNTLRSSSSVGIVPGYFIDHMTTYENQREEFAIFKLRVSLAIYTDVVCKQLFDAVAKNVHYFLVSKICDGFTEWMLDKGTTANLKVWFAEDAEAKQTRVETERALAKFQEGLLILETAGVSRS